MRSWIWAPLLILLGIGVGWQFMRMVPRWIEEIVEASLLENEIVVGAFPVEDLGLHETKIGEGVFLFQSHSLNWESLWVQYSPIDLVAGRVDEIFLNEPVISLRFFPDAHAFSPDLPELARGEETTERPAIEPSVGPPHEPSLAIVDSTPLSSGTFPTLRKQILELPMEGLFLSDGKVDFLRQEASFFSMGLEGRLENQPYGIAGEVSLANELVSAHVSLRVPKKEPVITFQAEAAMPPGGLRDLGNRLLELREDCQELPSIVSSGQFVMDLFVELLETGERYASTEASIDELTLRFPGFPEAIRLHGLLLAGIYKGEQLSIEGGMEILPPEWGMFRVDPFGLRYSYKPEAGLDVETEAFDWSMAGFKGRSALRGSLGSLTPGDGNLPRVEWSFSSIASDQIRIEPFSVLLEKTGNQLHVRASPAGLVRAKTIWLEEFKTYWDLTTKTGSSGLAWFNASGKRMGSVTLDLEAPQGAPVSARFSFISEGTKPFLTGSLVLDGDAAELKAKGALWLPWINSLGAWWGIHPIDFSGNAPLLDLNLSGTSPFYKGSAMLNLAGLNVELGNGALLKNVTGDASFLMNGLPRTDGSQHLRIEGIESGGVSLTDVAVEWELSTFRNLDVHALSAKTGRARVWLEAFSVDPLNPAMVSTLHFEELEGNQLLEWLGEKRFAIKGTVSGWLEIGWDQGSLVIGDGSISMDTTQGDARFEFVDPEFLNKQFASFSGVPADVKDRFLEALLEQGIKIHSLHAELGASTEPGNILLRISISGESRTNRLEVPIKEFVINNVISAEDLGHVLGLYGPVRLMKSQ